jgi:putative FmdB family regulatory protein
MPIYEFECEQCGRRFDELLAAEDRPPPCPTCGSDAVRRRLSDFSPPGRQPRGPGVRGEEARRREREAGHRERLARDRARRARGEKP